jgi:CheY-like chemotaxis protein
MSERERVIELLLEIETETAAFYEALARDAGGLPDLCALWSSLAEEERQHVGWVRRLRESVVAERALASLPALPVVSLEAAVEEVKRQRRWGERGGGSSADALAAAIAIETAEASRALADLVVAAVRHDPGLGALLPAPAAHLGRLAAAARRLRLFDLADAAQRLAAGTGSGADGGRTVLIVDDDPDMTETCARILRSNGHECLTAAGGREALDLLRSRRLDLILADLRMPEMDGLTLLAHARRLAPQVPVVIITAYGSQETARRAREAGAAAYLAKPFGIGELQEVVARALPGPRG